MATTIDNVDDDNTKLLESQSYISVPASIPPSNIIINNNENENEEEKKEEEIITTGNFNVQIIQSLPSSNSSSIQQTPQNINNENNQNSNILLNEKNLSVVEIYEKLSFTAPAIIVTSIDNDNNNTTNSNDLNSTLR